MKNLFTLACCVCLSFFSFRSSAQQTNLPINEPDQHKPELFKQSPKKVAIQAEEMTSLLATSVGEPIDLNLPSFHFEGTVIAAVSKYANKIQSVVIRSSNYEGATLTLSRITDEAGRISYAGRIISLKSGDLYELKQVDNGFALIKNSYNRVVVE